MFDRCIVSVLLFFSFVASASSSELTSLDGTTFSRSIKCEVGRFAQSLKGYKPPAGANMKIAVSVIDKTSGGTVFGGSLKIPVFFDFSGSLDDQTAKIVSAEGIQYNIHPDNAINCKKRNVVREGIGVLRCLQEQKELFIDAVDGGTGSISCSKQITAKRGVSASGGIPVWIVTIGPSGGWSETRDFTFLIVAPPKPAK
jgi:hypothetical protein